MYFLKNFPELENKLDEIFFEICSSGNEMFIKTILEKYPDIDFGYNNARAIGYLISNTKAEFYSKILSQQEHKFNDHTIEIMNKYYHKNIYGL